MSSTASSTPHHTTALTALTNTAASAQVREDRLAPAPSTSIAEPVTPCRETLRKPTQAASQEARARRDLQVSALAAQTPLLRVALQLQDLRTTQRLLVALVEMAQLLEAPVLVLVAARVRVYRTLLRLRGPADPLALALLVLVVHLVLLPPAVQATCKPQLLLWDFCQWPLWLHCRDLLHISRADVLKRSFLGLVFE